MKTIIAIRTTLVAAAVLLPAAIRAEENVTNRITFTARMGFNIAVRFKGTAGNLPATPRATQRGDGYNYDDGYVLPDIAKVEYGNTDGQTWYWGYDDSASQISGNTILLSRSTPSGAFTSPWMEDNPMPGFEITYNGRLASVDHANFGIEVGGSFMDITLRNSSSFSGRAARVTDAYPFAAGTTPPSATPASPYQGSYEGPGFLIGDAPVNSTSAMVPGGFTVSGGQRFSGALWGLRLGPYVDFPLGQDVNIWVSGGVVGALLVADAQWSDTISLPGAGSLPTTTGHGHEDAFLWGAFASANIAWDLGENWSLVGGVQFQYLEDFSHNFGGRTVELDWGNTWFATVGFCVRF